MGEESQKRCLPALEDGTVFHGSAFGARGTTTGEVVFNTAQTGYQEMLTDPSYYEQMVTLTYPLIANYGVNAADVESAAPQVRGLIVREAAHTPSHHRAAQSLPEYLSMPGVIGISGIDTRALTRKLRVDGVMRGVHTTEMTDARAAVQRARAEPYMGGTDLVAKVAPGESSLWPAGLDREFGSARPATDVPRRC